MTRTLSAPPLLSTLLCMTSALLTCLDAPPETPSSAHESAMNASTDAPATATQEASLRPLLMQLTEQDRAEGARLARGMKGTQLAEFRNFVSGMPEKRRRALLHLVRPDGEPAPAGAALAELSNDAIREWSDTERQHLLAATLHWIGVPATQGQAANVAADLAPHGLPKVLHSGLVDLTRDTSATTGVRTAALVALTMTRGLSPEAVAALKSALESKQAQLRFAGLGANGRFVDTHAFWKELAPEVAGRLKDPEPIIRAAAARMLVENRESDGTDSAAPSATLPAARALLEDPSPGLRCWGAMVLREFGEAEDVAQLAKSLDDDAKCTDLPRQRFVNVSGGVAVYKLNPRSTSTVAHAAAQAIWALTPPADRPADLGDPHRDRLPCKPEALNVMRAWYAAR